MSKLDLAKLLQERTSQLNMSKSSLARLSGVSRQTIYKLYNAEIDEAKVSTLIKVSQSLRLHPLDLFRTYFNGMTIKNKELPDDSGFLGDVTYPDNSIVMPNQIFTKVWNVKNLGNTTWINRRLVCMDDHIESSSKNNNFGIHSQRGLKPISREIIIPETKPGKSVQLSIEFKAPAFPCSTISYWKSIDEKGNYCFPKKEGLSCHVKVVTI